MLTGDVVIKDDIIAKAKWNYGNPSRLNCIRAFASDATFSLVLYRMMVWLNKYSFLKPFAAVLCKTNAIICGAVIGRGAQFGKRLIILHSVGIVINSQVICGSDIILESGVVIGANKRKSPKLGNNIFIGSGAKIFGGIHIGNNVDIGANAVVNKDVPDNVTVGGVPAKILKYKH